ncbi:MAG: carboxylesterase family protein, partial [Sphingomonas sp.]|uniref:carboxylesterase family protein n=1 Tax=Sphingomonas sp. TaxID=28214 RepID=UPI003F7F44AB
MSDADGWNRRTMIGAGASAGAAMLLSGVARAAGAPYVRAPSGNFVGESDRGVTAFRGIRYGVAQRFRAPVPYAAPGQTRQVTKFGPVCPQSGRYQPQAEDCLYLNVWTAEADPAAKKPVMLYIHGGAYSNGSVTDPLNDGHNLAARGDVVVVTVNHRLNAFGYLYLARL